VAVAVVAAAVVAAASSRDLQVEGLPRVWHPSPSLQPPVFFFFFFFFF
jgi:hypothetical protein